MQIYFLILASLCLAKFGSAGTYRAAVAEHRVDQGDGTQTLNEVVTLNLDIYQKHVETAAKNGAKIIVFPEFGLTPIDSSNRTALGTIAEKVPDVPKEGESPVIPCGNPSFSTNSILARASCMAKESQISVLVNMIDWKDCSPSSDAHCPSDNHYQFNTDAVFNEYGHLSARYHKSHEWKSFIPSYDQPATPERVTYKASFGVEFGLFICFDIMFPDPAKVLVDSGIRHFLYAVQQGEIGEDTVITAWSKRNQVTILSANTPGKKFDCSGIIASGTTLPSEKFYLGPSTGQENVLVSDVPF